MKMTPEDAEAAKNRRLKEPLIITGYDIVPMKVSLVGEEGPRTRQVFAPRRIETIGDLAALDAHTKLGKFLPMPDLSLQALMIVIDKMGLLEEKDKEKEESPDERSGT
jgi:hypothetical protein